MTNKPELTTRQREIFEFLKDKIENRGYGPTVREIGNEFGIKSPNGVMCHLKALEKKGYIIREAHMSRAIQVVGRVTPGSLTMAGTIAAGLPVLAAEDLETIDFADIFAHGNAVLRVADESLEGDAVSHGDFLVRDGDENDVAVIRRY
jgi:repressor LexA